jgi:hypothetical protein
MACAYSARFFQPRADVGNKAESRPDVQPHLSMTDQLQICHSKPKAQIAKERASLKRRLYKVMDAVHASKNRNGDAELAMMRRKMDTDERFWQEPSKHWLLSAKLT